MASFILYLKAGERLFINGGVVRPDRKVALEVLNDVNFLLEAHVLQVEDATTPLRQLYLVAQTALMDPNNAEPARALFASHVSELFRATRNGVLHQELPAVAECMRTGRTFEALKRLRELFETERSILDADRDVERCPSHLKGRRYG